MALVGRRTRGLDLTDEICGYGWSYGVIAERSKA